MNPTHNDIYHFKATYILEKGDEPYRVFAIEKYKSMTDLAEAILDSFKFSFDHCFGFYNNIKNWTNSTLCYECFVDLEDKYFAKKDAKSPDKTNIETGFSTKIPFIFLFDYGDEWKFKIELIGEEEIIEGKVYPFLIEEHGTAPNQY